MRVNRIIILLVSLFLFSSLVYAMVKPQNAGLKSNDAITKDVKAVPTMLDSGKQNMSDKMGVKDAKDVKDLSNSSDVSIEQKTQNKGEETRLMVENQIKTLKQDMEQKKKQMQTEAEKMGGKSAEVLKKQNQVRVAAQTLLQMASIMGGIGKNVSEIAKHFENSVQSTIKSEEKIKSRSAFSRFFAGGDEKAAKELEQEVKQNKEQLKRLNKLMEDCDSCDIEVKTMMQEQIKAMEQEQDRLEGLAQKEQKSKGLFGWIWK